MMEVEKAVGTLPLHSLVLFSLPAGDASLHAVLFCFIYFFFGHAV